MHKKMIAVGAGAVLGADLGAGYLPDAFDFGGLPVRKWGAAIAGAYLGAYAAGSKVSVTHAAILGVTALAAAELKNNFLPSVSFAVGPVDVARVAAGVGGVYFGHKFGLE